MDANFELKLLLNNAGKTLSLAESCTGGMISHLVTMVPGASEYYIGSTTVYAPSFKCKLLGVQQETIEKYGIVSKQVAVEMAEGVRKLTGSTYSLSITGWADAVGDEHEKAGTAWIAISSEGETVTSKLTSNLSAPSENMDFSSRLEYRNSNIELFARLATEKLAEFIKCRLKD